MYASFLNPIFVLQVFLPVFLPIYHGCDWGRIIWLTGKTHISIGLGIKAAIAEYRVFFTTVPLLINQIKKARGASTLRSFELKFEKYDLVIADELP